MYWIEYVSFQPGKRSWCYLRWGFKREIESLVHISLCSTMIWVYSTGSSVVKGLFLFHHWSHFLDIYPVVAAALIGKMGIWGFVGGLCSKSVHKRADAFHPHAWSFRWSQGAFLFINRVWGSFAKVSWGVDRKNETISIHDIWIIIRIWVPS